MYSLKMKDLIRDSFKGITPNYVDHSNVIVLNQKCIRNNQIDFSLARFHDSKKTYPSKKELQVGDILINSTGAGTAGRCAFIRELPKNYSVVADSHILVVRISDFFIAGCVQYSLFNIEKLLQTFLDGSTGQGEFDKQRLLNVIIPIPNNPKYIYQFLSNLDKKITLNKQINARLEEMAKTLYDYWFVQFDFPDAKGKPYKSSGGEMVFDETLKREIPKGWEVKSLNQVADIVMGQSPDGASYNLEQEGTIFFQGSTDFDWRFPNVRQYTTSPTRFAQKGDILLSVRAPVGDLNIAPFECCIGRGLAALRSKSGNNSFLFYVMKYFKTVFERRNTEGTTFGSITKDDLHSLKLVAPADNVLEKYNEIASKYDEMIFIRSQQNHQLTQLRDFLLPMLMNGQVSVAE